MVAKKLIAAISETVAYRNFSEEVTVNSETRSGTSSLYTVTDKHGTKFSNVIGGPGSAVNSKVIMGFIQGDKGRPIILAGAQGVAINNTASDAPVFAVISAGGQSGIQADIAPGMKWDIRQEISASGGECAQIVTKDDYIQVQ